MKIGSLVELINDKWGANYDDGVTYPVKRKTYTVREIDSDDRGEPCITLEEIINSKRVFYRGLLEPAFYMKRFRELMPPIENIEEFINENTLEYV